MATFAEASFDAATYASFRPPYPSKLFQTVYDYHARTPRAAWNKAVDLGCGPGQVTTGLAGRFEHVVGVDPSNTMIAQAQALSSSSQSKVVPTYRVGNSEDLPFLEDNSVDLVTVGEAVHWFDFDRFWPELARVLKKGGSAAFWGYSDFRLPDYPHLTPQIISFYAPSNLAGVGVYWEQPGWSILAEHLTVVRPPNPLFTSVDRIHFTGTEDLGESKEGRVEEMIIRKKCTWQSLEAYLRTLSSVHTYVREHPEDSEAEGGDIVKRFLTVLKEGVGEGVQELVAEWPLTLILAKKA